MTGREMRSLAPDSGRPRVPEGAGATVFVPLPLGAERCDAAAMTSGPGRDGAGPARRMDRPTMGCAQTTASACVRCRCGTGGQARRRAAAARTVVMMGTQAMPAPLRGRSGCRLLDGRTVPFCSGCKQRPAGPSWPSQTRRKPASQLPEAVSKWHGRPGFHRQCTKPVNRVHGLPCAPSPLLRAFAGRSEQRGHAHPARTSLLPFSSALFAQGRPGRQARTRSRSGAL